MDSKNVITDFNNKEDPDNFDSRYNKKLELYKILRSQIQHEDSLVNHRLTWLLVTQAFLFTGYFATLNTYLDTTKKLEQKDVWFIIIMFLIPIGGVFLVFFSFRSIIGAFEAIKAIRKYWYGNFPEEGLPLLDNNWNFPNTDSDDTIISITKDLPEITFVGEVSKKKKIPQNLTTESGIKMKSFWETLELMFQRGVGSRTTAFGTPMVIFCVWLILLLLQTSYIIKFSIFK